MRLLFLSAAFLTAFLLFCVQPMIARMVLAQFGGSPAVWNTYPVFFQAALLAGYALAHAASGWLNPRRLAVLQLELLARPIPGLPIAVPAGAVNASEPAPRLLGLLLPAVGPPLLVVATTAPLLQPWFAATGHRRVTDPHFLYAASNTGSLLAPVGYVDLIEPILTEPFRIRDPNGDYDQGAVEPRTHIDRLVVRPVDYLRPSLGLNAIPMLMPPAPAVAGPRSLG